MKEDYFEVIDTKEKAYWLGFLYGDGYIDKPQRRVKLQLCAKDVGQIDRFLQAIDSDAVKRECITKLYYKNEVREYKSYAIDIGNKKMAGDLVRLGCTYKKSLTIRYNGFHQKDLDLAFLMGFFDADGYETGTQVCSGSIQFLEDLRQYFNVQFQVIKKPTAYLLTLGASLFREMLNNYSDSMPRKRQFHKVQPKVLRKRKDQTIMAKLCQQCNCFFPVYESKQSQEYCSYDCSYKSQRKAKRPTKEQLGEEIKEFSWRALGRKYGVSDNAVRKWAKRYGLTKI